MMSSLANQGNLRPLCCHCDHTVHIAELVMSQKMAAFVLASMGKVCWRVFHCQFADTA